MAHAPLNIHTCTHTTPTFPHLLDVHLRRINFPAEMEPARSPGDRPARSGTPKSKFLTPPLALRRLHLVQRSLCLKSIATLPTAYYPRQEKHLPKSTNMYTLPCVNSHLSSP